MKVLVTRTDRLGDLVLSVPVFAALKTAQPDWDVQAMVAPGAVPLVENDPHLSRVWTWRDDLPDPEVRELTSAVRAAGFDAVVMLQYRRQLAGLCREAGIMKRYGPWSKWTSWFLLNRGQRQNRSGGVRHEMEFNLELGQRLLADQGTDGQAMLPTGPRLYLDQAQSDMSWEFRKGHGGATGRIIFLHPGSGGSALDWEPERFADVANSLAADDGCQVFITGAGPDAPVVNQVAGRLDPAVTVLLGQYDLRGFLPVLAAGDLMIGPSTGPLHLAAALGVPTLGLFPPVATMHPDRWGPRGFRTERPRNLVPNVKCPAQRRCQHQKCRLYNCMNELAVPAVLAAAREILESGCRQRGLPTED